MVAQSSLWDGTTTDTFVAVECEHCGGDVAPRITTRVDRGPMDWVGESCIVGRADGWRTTVVAVVSGPLASCPVGVVAECWLGGLYDVSGLLCGDRVHRMAGSLASELGRDASAGDRGRKAVIMEERMVVYRPSGVVSLLQRVVDGLAGSGVGAAPITIQGIGRNPKMWDHRCYFDLEDPDAPTVRIRAWMEGKQTPEWNHVIVVSALIRFKVKKPGIAVEPELEVLGLQETMVATTSRDELRLRFAGALRRAKAGVAELFLKEKPRLVLVTNQGGEADRDIRTQLSGYEDLLTFEVLPVKMTNPESVAQAFRTLQGRVGQVDCVVVARGGGEGIQALEHESVLSAVSERVIPVMTAIGHASHATLLDELADLTFPVPGALGRWLRDQLELKARRVAEQKRVSLMEIEKDHRTLLGKYEVLEKERTKDRQEMQAKLAQIESERAKERTAKTDAEIELGSLRKERADILSDQVRWRRVALGAGGVIVVWVAGRVMGWW